MKIACSLILAAYLGRQLVTHIANDKVLLVVIDEIMIAVLNILAQLCILK